MLTKEILKKLAPRAKEEILDGIVEYQHLLEEYDITPGNRVQMFLAQLAHESAGFKTTVEYASGRAYEGRKDLGNTQPGDGVRYKGRGLIQLTGRHNYTLYSKLVEIDIVNNPELVAEFPLALEVSVLYWSRNKLNALADKGDFERITRRINGGLNGYEDRQRYLRIAKELNL